MLLGEITFRQFRVMVEHLPTGHAAARHLGDPSWTEQLLWDIAYHVRAQIVQTDNVYRPKGTQARKPEGLPRPYEDMIRRHEEATEAEQVAVQRAELEATLARPLPARAPAPAETTTQDEGAVMEEED
ncbi:MAG: hypothetical protein QJR09_11865 [Micrococcus sp.]|nr:hypothetical protein [Micrococcus sp.]